MKLLYRFTIKRRLFYSAIVFSIVLLCQSFLAWFSFQVIYNTTRDNGNIELANSQIQKTIRSLNEYVISEGTDPPIKTALLSSKQFKNACALIIHGKNITALSTRIAQEILPQWEEI